MINYKTPYFFIGLQYSNKNNWTWDDDTINVEPCCFQPEQPKNPSTTPYVVICNHVDTPFFKKQQDKYKNTWKDGLWDDVEITMIGGGICQKDANK